MKNQKNLKEINDVQDIVSQLIPLTEKAEQKFKSARNWGMVDIFGGGLITNLIKHSKLSSAADIMNRIQNLLVRLQKELSEIYIPTDFTMNVGTFVTFADFVFDGVLIDIYMQSKIISSLEQIRELKSRLIYLEKKLAELAARQ